MRILFFILAVLLFGCTGPNKVGVNTNSREDDDVPAGERLLTVSNPWGAFLYETSAGEQKKVSFMLPPGNPIEAKKKKGERISFIYGEITYWADRADFSKTAADAPGEGMLFCGDYVLKYPLSGYKIRLANNGNINNSLESVELEASNFMVSIHPQYTGSWYLSGNLQSEEIKIGKTAARLYTVPEPDANDGSYVRLPGHVLTIGEGKLTAEIFNDLEDAMALLKKVFSSAEETGYSKFIRAALDNKPEDIREMLKSKYIKKYLNCYIDLYNFAEGQNITEDVLDTALSYGAAEGFDNLAEIMIKAGADLNKSIPLYKAIRNDHMKIAKMLVDSGADKDIGILNDFIYNKDTNAVAHCIELGFDLNKKDKSGNTPLFLACGTERYSMIADQDMLDLLIGHGVSINTTDDYGNSILMNMISYDDSVEEIRKILDRGIDTAIRNTNRETALMIALGRKKIEIARLLLGYRIDLNIMDKKGRLPITEAVESGLPFDIISNIAGRTTNIDVPRYNDYLFSYVAAYGEYRLVELFIKKGADVNRKNQFGITPLMTAAYYERPDVVRLLVENGADVRAKDNKGETALDRARKTGSKEIADYLAGKMK